MDPQGYQLMGQGVAGTVSPLGSGTKSLGMGVTELSPKRRKTKENARIKVCVRIRPMLTHEEQQGHQATKIMVRDEKHIEVTNTASNEDSG